MVRFKVLLGSFTQGSAQTFLMRNAVKHKTFYVFLANSDPIITRIWKVPQPTSTHSYILRITSLKRTSDCSMASRLSQQVLEQNPLWLVVSNGGGKVAVSILASRDENMLDFFLQQFLNTSLWSSNTLADRQKFKVSTFGIALLLLGVCE